MTAPGPVTDTTNPDEKRLAMLPNLPPVCEVGDLAAVLRWNDSADADCGGAGSWLLVGEDLPTPLCDKHARQVEERLPAGYLASMGMQLVSS